ncbi:hypothetical protein LTR56_007198 [Elasticomyces elasticus]|nr:hypothetical protein LTR22_014397 [Elasticomyces elasticus]KAK3649066.1 hypothetical protein LTR56_007198 [Elasticomyces elasticus]KAK4913217.1 hypothetical protein LTR49_018392 [Elasticomyces elasticus]KAK5752235.1 hypothetical protein LTS12_017732 [Elasticomyces elasticus]
MQPDRNNADQRRAYAVDSNESQTWRGSRTGERTSLPTQQLYSRSSATQPDRSALLGLVPSSISQTRQDANTIPRTFVGPRPDAQAFTRDGRGSYPTLPSRYPPVYESPSSAPHVTTGSRNGGGVSQATNGPDYKEPYINFETLARSTFATRDVVSPNYRPAVATNSRDNDTQGSDESMSDDSDSEGHESVVNKSKVDQGNAHESDGGWQYFVITVHLWVKDVFIRVWYYWPRQGASLNILTRADTTAKMVPLQGAELTDGQDSDRLFRRGRVFAVPLSSQETLSKARIERNPMFAVSQRSAANTGQEFISVVIVDSNDRYLSALPSLCDRLPETEMVDP